MSEQANKALVLSNRLSAFSRDCCNDMHSAAAELRRLHSVNAELLEALRALLINFESQHGLLLDLGAPEFVSMRDKARAAVASAFGQ